jgi:hypothetical protein
MELQLQKGIESYKHKYAKRLLMKWLIPNFLSVRKEESICENSEVLFVPDITCYDCYGRQVIFEIEHKHGLDERKLALMQLYYWNNQIHVKVYEISAEWILCQVGIPEEIKAIKMIDFT